MRYAKTGCKIQNIIAVDELISMSKQHFSGNYFFKGESHNFYEVVCVLDGTVGITAGKEVFVLRAGQMTVHPPAEFHAIWEHNGSMPTCLIFSFSASLFPRIKSHIYTLCDSLLQALGSIYEASKDIFRIQQIPEPLHFQNGETLVLDFGCAVSGIRENMHYAAVKFTKELELFLLSALEAPSDIAVQGTDRSGENYTKILEVMEAHLYKNLTLTEISVLCGMSAPLIEKTMYRFLRCGAMAYYNAIRMNKAFDLLLRGESVKSTAFLLGFSNQNYFSLRFKKHFGYPPSALKSR